MNISIRCENGLMRLYKYLRTSHSTFDSFLLSLSYYSQVEQPHTMILYFRTFSLEKNNEPFKFFEYSISKDFKFILCQNVKNVK